MVFLSLKANVFADESTAAFHQCTSVKSVVIQFSLIASLKRNLAQADGRNQSHWNTNFR